MHALLFHNPTAGSGEYSGEALVALIRDAGFSVTYCSTKSRDFAEWLREPADIFIAAGGDGTVGKILTGMPDRSIPLAVLPLGTANNIARTLGISGRPDQIAAGWKSAAPRPFDIGSASGPWGRRTFVEAIGIGALAQAIHYVHSLKIEGKKSLQLGAEAFAKVLKQQRPLHFHVTVDANTVGGEVLLAEIMNIGLAGPGLPLASDADPGDGLFDVVTLAPEPCDKMLAWLADPHGAPPLTVMRGKRIELLWTGACMRIDDRFPESDGASHRIVAEFEHRSALILGAVGTGQIGAKPIAEVVE